MLFRSLQKAGATVTAFDPAAMEHAEKLLPGVEWKKNPYDVALKADALVILTEWNEFRSLDLDRLKELLNEPLLIDFRNIYKIEEMRNAGFHYISIGRGPVAPYVELKRAAA